MKRNSSLQLISTIIIWLLLMHNLCLCEEMNLPLLSYRNEQNRSNIQLRNRRERCGVNPLERLRIFMISHNALIKLRSKKVTKEELLKQPSMKRKNSVINSLFILISIVFIRNFVFT